MTKLETWAIDIETKPMIAYIWERNDINVALNQIKEDWSVLAWSAIRLDAPEKEMVYYDLRHKKDYTDDKAILKPMWNILDKADIIISHNGKSFDTKKLNARFIEHRMGRPSEYKHFDTWILASKVAAFTSTSLDYITNKLDGRYKKLSHKEFPGQSLWTECLNGNFKAWNEMKRYNIHDTLATRERAIMLKEWAPKAFPDWNDEKCSSCGTIKRLKLKCQECGKWHTQRAA